MTSKSKIDRTRGITSSRTNLTHPNRMASKVIKMTVIMMMMMIISTNAPSRSQYCQFQCRNSNSKQILMAINHQVF